MITLLSFSDQVALLLFSSTNLDKQLEVRVCVREWDSRYRQVEKYCNNNNTSTHRRDALTVTSTVTAPFSHPTGATATVPFFDPVGVPTGAMPQTVTVYGYRTSLPFHRGNAVKPAVANGGNTETRRQNWTTLYTGDYDVRVQGVRLTVALRSAGYIYVSVGCQW